jgi:hypothetical protein
LAPERLAEVRSLPERSASEKFFLRRLAFLKLHSCY